MSQEQDNLIPIDAPKRGFESFLRIDKNRRIFFSGKFGIGKTFFLQKFFEEHNDKYDTYHLFPVRYQIASNENIVELLKYDILVELLKKYPAAFQGNEAKRLSWWNTLFVSFFKERASINGFLRYAIESGEDVLGLSPDPFFQLLGKLGRPLKDLLVIDKKFQDFKKKYLASDRQVVEKFIKEAEQSADMVSTDYLSHLLRTKIAELKAEKKSVLILDDFDRIDPEHIFRILNVLSTHMEDDEGNRFGFDHIIIVGDIRNLKSVFHHKYGVQTEFWGYFDKFFTVQPFPFDNGKAIAERISYLIQRIKYEDLGLKDALGQSGIVKSLLEEVFGRAFAIGAMNLRQLYKPVNHSFPEVQKGVYHQDPFFSDQRNQCIDIGIKLLIAIYGDKEHFLEVLKKIRDLSSSVVTMSDQLYAIYSNSMLRRMLSLKPGEKISWLGKYPVVATQNDSNSSLVDIYLDEEVKAQAQFFYDTLIEYVMLSKYDKRNGHEYEN